MADSVKISAEELAHFLKKVRFGSDEILFKFDSQGLEVRNASNSDVGITGFLNKEVFDSIVDYEFVIPDLKLFSALLSRFRTSKIKLIKKDNYIKVNSKFFQVDLPIMRREYFKPFEIKKDLEPLFSLDIDVQKFQDVLSVLSVAKGEDVILSFDKNGILHLKVIGVERMTARIKIPVKKEKHIKLNLKKFIAILSLFADEASIGVYDNFILLKDISGISSIFYYIPALVVDNLENMVLEHSPSKKAKDLGKADDFDVDTKQIKKRKKNVLKKGKKK